MIEAVFGDYFFNPDIFSFVIENGQVPVLAEFLAFSSCGVETQRDIGHDFVLAVWQGRGVRGDSARRVIAENDLFGFEMGSR